MPSAPQQRTDPPLTSSEHAANYSPQFIARFLAMSDERDQWERLIHASWFEGHRYGRQSGYAAGRRDESAGRDEAWRRNAGMIVAQLDPGSRQARESAGRRVLAAIAGGRRDAQDHWDEFMLRAAETPQEYRTPPQEAAMQAPSRRTWRGDAA